MPDFEPITREEKLLDGEDLTPITRKEQFIKRIYDNTQVIPEPITREEYFLKKAGEGGGGDVTIEQLNVSENGTYSESGKAYSPVVVDVPQTTLTTLDVTENGTYTAPSGTAYNEVDVDVPLPSNAYLLKELSNLPQPIASFNDGAEDLPLKSLTASIVPVQSGSGDPSPTNVRPISGWTEEVVTRTGKNLYSHNGISIYDYGFSQQIAFSQMRNPVFMKGGQKYVLSLSDNITLYRMRAFDKSQNLVTDSSIVNAQNQGSGIGLVFYTNGNFFGYNGLGVNSITTFQPTEDIWFDMTVKTTSPSQVMFEIGDTPTTYEPYSGTTYTIPFTDSQGNPVEVYGGSVDVVNGVVTPCPYYASYNGEQLTGEWISDRDVYSPNTSPTIGAQVVNIGATGTPFSVQPTAVKSLDGVNNVFASTGDVEELKYFSKEV